MRRATGASSPQSESKTTPHPRPLNSLTYLARRRRGSAEAVTFDAWRCFAYPALLKFPSPELRVYPRETVVAEKFEAMVQLGMANSRMKDFYDIWMLARQFGFDGSELCAAIRATFEHRQTLLPSTTPLSLTTEFSTDRAKATQWNAFVQKGRLSESPPKLEEVISLLQSFLMPPTRAMVDGEPWSRRWLPVTWQ